jgi:chorismate dehydratase
LLKLGKVSYINTLPFFYYFNFPQIQIVEGVPSELAKLLKIGYLDIGLVSSVFFLQNEANYIILPDLSISSFGDTKSVLIISKKPLEEIKSLKFSTESLTSNFLAYAILRKFLKKQVKISSEKFDAEVVIGDKALFLQETEPYLYKYDVGKLWFQYTGLPAVYAVFAAKRTQREDILELYASLALNLQESRERFFKNLSNLSLEKDIKNYLKSLDYRFLEPHLESLKLIKELIRDYYLGKL